MTKIQKSELWAIIPAYNERHKIAGVIEGTLPKVSRIIVVDDGSKDGTSKRTVKYPVVLLKHITNLGKGGALKTGCEYAFANGAEAVVLLDSDGQHDPAEIGKIVEPLQHGKDIVFGARSFDGNMPIMMKFGNRLINGTMKLLFGVELSDTQSGFRAFTKKAYKEIRWKSRDYSVESEMIAKTGMRGLKHAEVRIKTIYSDKYKGTTVFDGIKIVGDLIRWKIMG